MMLEVLAVGMAIVLGLVALFIIGVIGCVVVSMSQDERARQNWHNGGFW